jgi:hypothetical protein
VALETEEGTVIQVSRDVALWREGIKRFKVVPLEWDWWDWWDRRERERFWW